MFKKILQSLSKSQHAKTQAPTPPAPQPQAKSPAAASQKVAPAAAPAVPQTPEELCEISPKMPKDQIMARLKLLYRRYNRGASSLDAKVRLEADRMLDAIVIIREKHFGEL